MTIIAVLLFIIALPTIIELVGLALGLLVDHRWVRWLTVLGLVGYGVASLGG